MPPLKILICGAGVAGNALAFWLSKLGHDVTVIERFPSLRTSGLQIDLRGHGIEIMKRMGLEEVIRANTVDEQGLEIVDGSGKARLFVPANKTGTGTQSFTSEFEIMRGDLCQILYDAAGRARAKYQFGKFVESLDDKGDTVEAVFSDGSEDRFDLVVGADGIGSRTRRMILGSGKPDVVDYLGESISYFTIPREAQPGEQWMGRGCIGTGPRWVFTRRHKPDRIQVYLGCEVGRLEGVERGDAAEEKKAVERTFRGLGWETDDILDLMMEHADDFYCERLGVVKMPSWSDGRLTLIGDAAWCPTPRRGMGVTSSLVGAYILAGEIGRSGDQHDLASALKAYEQKFRPFMDQVQRGISSEKGWVHIAFDKILSTSTGVRLLYCVITLIGWLRLDKLLSKFFEGEIIKDWNLPDYDMLDGEDNGA